VDVFAGHAGLSGDVLARHTLGAQVFEHLAERTLAGARGTSAVVLSYVPPTSGVRCGSSCSSAYSTS
jgi:hypothetical protein